jgi:dienelactone hydrolase
MMKIIDTCGRSLGRWTILVFFGVVLLACQSYSDIELTWHQAIVALPPSERGEEAYVGRLGNSEVAARVKRYPFGTRLPLVVYLHGCTGIGQIGFLRSLARAGYAVIAPDSMARRFRPLQCDPETLTGGYNRFVYDFRLTEVSFGLNRLQYMDWIDPNNLFLIGISEGGVAAALYRGDEFRARVIAQWTCRGAPIVEGLAAPVDEPILAIVNDADPWYSPKRTNLQTGNCGNFFGLRSGSSSLVLAGSAEHNVLANSGNWLTILKFLNSNRR